MKRRILWLLLDFGEWLQEWAESRLFPKGCKLEFPDQPDERQS